jgi:hypothetical protein
MATLIDVDKVTQAFDYLSETEGGRNALAGLHEALNKFQGQIQPDVNRGEFVYICRGLMDGLNVHEAQPTGDVSGYAQIPSAFFSGQANALTRAQASGFGGLSAQAFNRVNLSGFNIRMVA